MKRNVLILALAALSLLSASARQEEIAISTSGVHFSRGGGKFVVVADIVLDSLHLQNNGQVFVTPVVSGPDGQSVVMPSVLVTGRNMHYAYERGTMPGLADMLRRYDIVTESRRDNSRPQTVEYSAAVPLQEWMLADETGLRFVYDACGCGVQTAQAFGDVYNPMLNPASMMRVAYVTPEVTELPVSIHEGRARVQFEVDRTELHDVPYRCRDGQLIDNRAQLAVIDDSVRYALTDPNVEIAKIEITGYASPESPYIHNEELATGRSRALAEYLAGRYKLPAGRTDYSAVAENWAELRDIVVKADGITDAQRALLLEIIDSPAYGPSDYDARERRMKTDPQLAALYRSTILPKWFPQLRATNFRISTRLRPASDEKLAEIIDLTPEKMSLNQMMRVARLYPEGSDEFNRVIETALRYYPDSEEARLNAVAAALGRRDYDRAEALLQTLGDSPEAMNARGILLTRRGRFDEADRAFEAAGNLPEAVRNKKILDPADSQD